MTLGAAPGSPGKDMTAPDAVGTGDVGTAAGPLSAHSRFAQRLRRRYAADLALLPAGAPGARELAATYEALRGHGLDVPSALRVLRQLVLERLVTLDCDRQAPLAVITSVITELAEFALDVACNQAFADLDALHG